VAAASVKGITAEAEVIFLHKEAGPKRPGPMRARRQRLIHLNKYLIEVFLHLNFFILLLTDFLSKTVLFLYCSLEFDSRSAISHCAEF